ncbi:MAG: hypothetical protein ACW99F_17440, partial [Candidatus Hodarchaeales archaeon]
AIQDIKDLGMEIVFSQESLNETSFDGVDIWIATNPTKQYTSNERVYIRDFLLEGHGMLLLANPLMEENDSLNGRGDLLNDILSDEGLGIIARYWTESEFQGTFPLSDIVKNEFNNAGKPEYVILETNSTLNPIFSDYENITHIITTSCSIRSAKVDLIEGSTEAYAETPLKEKHTFSGDISVLSGVGQLNDFKSQVVIGGSSIMFSDIEEPLFNSSWYEVADNAKLWRNIISWLAEESQEEETDVPLSELFVPFFIGIISISVVFIIGGILTFNIGSGKEIQVTKSTLPDEVEKKPKKGKESEDKIEKKKPTKKLSKRDRRLQQIKKRKN